MAHSNSYFQYQKGDQGSEGNRGYRGWQGEQGYQGYQGHQGEPSTVAGPQGYQGTQGHPSSGFGIIELEGNTMGSGLIADQWTDTLFISGGPGITVTGNNAQDRLGIMVNACQDYSIGNISTVLLNPGSNPQVDITIHKAEDFPCNIVMDYDFGIPQGWQGDQGIVGQTGPQGASIKGDKGDQGDPSTVEGPQGDKGDEGDKGDKGDEGDKGDKGDEGDKGDKGDEGDKGDTGDQGAPGAQGNQGDPGEAFEWGDFTPEQLSAITGPQGAEGEEGPQGPSGGGDKYAIVPTTFGKYVGLFCAEMPTPYFEDIIKVNVIYPETIHIIDPTFLDVIEPGSLEVTSAVPSEPALVGAKIVGCTLRLIVSGARPTQITAKLSGIRKGRAGKRFPEYSADEAEQNTEFWDQWKKQK